MVIPKALDPCCGPKSFYFDKDSEDVLFCDIRGNFSETLCDGRILNVQPDMIADVTELQFDDGTFPLVVFDPPHLDVGNGWQVAKYGKLPPDWREWMTRAFSECWRVLAINGTLVFRWQNGAFHCVKQPKLKSMYFGDQWDRCRYHMNKYDNEQQKEVGE